MGPGFVSPEDGHHDHPADADEDASMGPGFVSPEDNIEEPALAF
jgi:hypothetical protein